MTTPPPITFEQRQRLLFALVAERLAMYYEHGQWMTVAQGASLAAQWLHRAELQLPLTERRALSDVSDDFARQTAAGLSQQAGLFTAHDMMEALEPRYQSATSADLLDECARLLREHGLDGAAAP